jgi:hypothetical protein
VALVDGLLTPLGLLALAGLVPLILLYFIRPNPEERRLPTLQFLAAQSRRESANPLLERLRRSLLLLVQILAIVLLALALAQPFQFVPERTAVEETVVVVDASASMATRTGDGTRFDGATAAAREAVTATTSVVVSGQDASVVLRKGGPPEARTALDEVTVTGTTGDLRTAIASAAAVAGEGARIVVYSDFVDASDWADAVQTARARGLLVDLEPFAGGGRDNVGIVDRSFSGNAVTLSVKNYGNSTIRRTLELGDQEAQLTLSGGDLQQVTFDVPAQGGAARLTPGDTFRVDDVAYVAAPRDATVDVLVLTNDRNRFLLTALSVIEQVSLTVESPPTTVDSNYDVVVYSNVASDRLLRSNVQAGVDAVENGGGVAVQAQTDLPGTLGSLLLLDPGEVRANPGIARVAEDPLTRGISFSPPEAYVSGTLAEGRPLVETTDGSPLLATTTRGSGRVLYYGYIEDSSSFKYNYQYPVFWKRVVFHLAGRQTLSELNYRTGTRLEFETARQVQTPTGTVTGRTVPLSATGFYTVGDRRVSASLLDERESDVAAAGLSADGEGSDVPVRREEQPVPRAYTPWVALAALAVTFGELVYLRRRGDL